MTNPFPFFFAQWAFKSTKRAVCIYIMGEMGDIDVQVGRGMRPHVENEMAAN